MTNTMKGLLKGLRYISQIFDEKEPELEIGLPTDVKHVAHIGLNGPSTDNMPTWMNGYDGGQKNAEEASSPPSIVSQSTNEKTKHKSGKKPSTATGSPLDSPREIEKRHSRCHGSANPSKDSPGYDSPNRHGRRRNTKSLGTTGSSMQDQPVTQKHSRRKKSKGSSDGGSGSSRSKHRNSIPSIADLASEFDEAVRNDESVRSSRNHCCSVLESHGGNKGRSGCAGEIKFSIK